MEEYKLRFGNGSPDKEYMINAYKVFISKLGDHYPKSHIICSLGCMDAAKDGSVWIEYIKNAVSGLNDKAVYTHFMLYIEATAHPFIDDHKVMANSLIKFIEQRIKW